MEETTLADAIRRGNPVVFFDVSVGGRDIGRIKLELFKDVAPRVRTIGRCFDFQGSSLVPAVLLLLRTAPHAPLFVHCRQ